MVNGNIIVISPYSDLRAPDASFVRAERLRRSPCSFAELALDLAVEVKSQARSLGYSQNQDFRISFTRDESWHPDQSRRTYYRRYRIGEGVVKLRDGDVLIVPDLLTSWKVSVADLWLPELE